jgi:large subunit ribosomal protein L5e
MKYRLVARETNKKWYAQIIYATIQGDKVLSSATSQELTKYGIPAGLTNYSAA